MKNNSKSKPAAIYSVEDNVIEQVKRELDNQHKEFIEKEVPYIASSFAHSNYPRQDDTSLLPYFQKIRGFYQRLKNDVPLKIQGVLQLMYGSLDIAKLDETIEKKTQQRLPLEKERNHLKDEKNKNGTIYNPNTYKWAKYLLWFMGFVDVVSAITAFLSVFSDNYFIAIVLGISIGVAILFLIKSAVLHFRDRPETSTTKKVKWIVILLLVFVAVIIGGLRYAQTADETIPNHTIYASPLVFIIINLLVMAATAYVIYMYYPSEKEIKDYENWQHLEDRIAAKENEVKQIDDEIEDLKDNKNAVAKYRLQLRHYQKVLYERIQAMYEEAFGVYVEHNLKHRSDGIYPLCFNAPIPPLDNMSNEDEKITGLLKQNGHEN